MTRATPEQFELRSQRMGALPLLGYFLERMGLAERLQSYLPATMPAYAWRRRR